MKDVFTVDTYVLSTITDILNNWVGFNASGTVYDEKPLSSDVLPVEYSVRSDVM